MCFLPNYSWAYGHNCGESRAINLTGVKVLQTNWEGCMQRSNSWWQTKEGACKGVSILGDGSRWDPRWVTRKWRHQGLRDSEEVTVSVDYRRGVGFLGLREGAVTCKDKTWGYDWVTDKVRLEDRRGSENSRWWKDQLAEYKTTQGYTRDTY